MCGTSAPHFQLHAIVAELAYVAALEAAALTGLGVRLPPIAPMLKMINPWDTLKDIADKAKAFLPKGPRQLEIDKAIKEWKEKGYDKKHDINAPVAQ